MIKACGCGQRVALKSATIGGLVLASAVQVGAQFGGPWTNEVTFRGLATKVVAPEYPPASQRRGVSGVAVVYVGIDQLGRIAHINVLEAPDELIAAATVKALRQWRLPALADHGKPTLLEAKVTYYFIQNGNAASVQAPADAPRLEWRGTRPRLRQNRK